MLELLTAAEMAEADRRTIAGGTPGIELMEAAGAAVAAGVARLAPTGPVLVVAGPGNNGGDGFVAARLLAAAGRPVTVVLHGDPDRLRGDAALARARWGRPTLKATLPLPPAALVVDALFGAGLDRPVTGAAAALVAAINAGPPVLAVDVPSGLHADTGRPLGVAVEAAATVTFFRRKPGHLLYPGRRLCGPVTVADIGIAAEVLAAVRPRAWENGPALWSGAARPPSAEDHKYRRGHALVQSGPLSRTGAARLAAGAALRAGAGLVTLGSPGGALVVNASHLTAVMLRRIDTEEDLAETLAEPRISAACLGPGLGTDTAARALVSAALATPKPVLLDADAITGWADDPEGLFAALADRGGPAVLTPHDGEFGRLFPDLAELPKPERTRAAAARAGAVVILKGPDTTIAAADGRLAINANAPPWLATAGSGDVLAGIVTGLLAQQAPAFEAACSAVWLHGAAGAVAGPGLTAEDLAPALRPVLAALWADGEGGR
jgi:hydroxyethylthiazole kinase-like uncharacterized protein yjeF